MPVSNMLVYNYKSINQSFARIFSVMTKFLKVSKQTVAEKNSDIFYPGEPVLRGF